jgi:hypothetical protein
VLEYVEARLFVGGYWICDESIEGVAVNAGSSFSFTLFFGLFNRLGLCDCGSEFGKGSSSS